VKPPPSAPNLLCSQWLRASPQLASLDVTVHAIEVAIVSLCAAHPNIEQQSPAHHLPIDHLADRIVDGAMTLLEAIDRYRLLVYDLEQLRCSEFPDTDFDV